MSSYELHCVDGPPRTAHAYVFVRNDPCCLIRTQGTLSTVPFTGKKIRRKKELLQVMSLKTKRFVTRKLKSVKWLKNRYRLIINFNFLF